jgi:hypothetical protein
LAKSILPEKLVGRFFGVGSLTEAVLDDAQDYVLDLALPYAYQRPESPEEDMIRQFGALLKGFEDEGTFIYDASLDAYREMLQNDNPLLPLPENFRSIYALPKGRRFPFFKSELTAPSTMCYSIRGIDGKQHLTPQMFRFYSTLMSRVAKGYQKHFADSVEKMIICQDDPSFGFVAEAIKVGNAPGLTARQMMKTTDSIYPDGIIPAYHYCYDWRVLEEEDTHLIWESKPKIAHLDLITYPPVVDEAQAELMNRFLDSGGCIALGILPNVDSAYHESVIEYFRKSLRTTLSHLAATGVSMDLLQTRCLVSTQCGLSGATPSLAKEIHLHDKRYSEIVMEMLKEYR